MGKANGVGKGLVHPRLHEVIPKPAFSAARATETEAARFQKPLLKGSNSYAVSIALPSERGDPAGGQLGELGVTVPRRHPHPLMG